MRQHHYNFAHRVLPMDVAEGDKLWAIISSDRAASYLEVRWKAAAAGATPESSKGLIWLAPVTLGSTEIRLIRMPPPQSMSEVHHAAIARGADGRLRYFIAEQGDGRVFLAEWADTTRIRYDVVLPEVPTSAMRARLGTLPSESAPWEVSASSAAGLPYAAALLVAVADEMESTPGDQPARPMQDHRVLPKLRHHRWKGWADGEIPSRPLVGLPMKGIPNLGVGEDTAERFQFVLETGARSFADWEAIAVRNLAKRSMEWQVTSTTKGFLGMGKKPTALRLIEEFACERILDPNTMHRAHELLHAGLLIVAIPVRGLMMARSAGAPEDTGPFLASAMAMFTNAPLTTEAISPLVFTVNNGAVVGVVRGSGEADVDVVPLAGFKLPMVGDDEPELDETDEDARLHYVGYLPATRSIHITGYLGENETLPAADIEKVRSWTARKTTSDGQPIQVVQVEFPDVDSARRARPALLPLGARVMVMNDSGEFDELR